jgi:hypothetical protein
MLQALSRRPRGSRARRGARQTRPFYLGLLGKSYGEAGDIDRARRILTALGDLARRQYVAPHCYVYILHGMGDRRARLEHQERAYEDGAPPPII